MELNAGHDLNLDNLPCLQELPGIKEVSIGHALISHALYGLWAENRGRMSPRISLGQDKSLSAPSGSHGAIR
jgi:pyridoxine 5'-phosphate synthase PdxJ